MLSDASTHLRRCNPAHPFQDSRSPGAFHAKVTAQPSRNATLPSAQKGPQAAPVCAPSILDGPTRPLCPTHEKPEGREHPAYHSMESNIENMNFKTHFSAYIIPTLAASLSALMLTLTAELISVSEEPLANYLSPIATLTAVLAVSLWIIISKARRRYVADGQTFTAADRINPHRSVSVGYDQIESYTVHRGIVGRVFNSGSITVRTAAGKTIHVRDIRNLSALDDILRLVVRNKQNTTF